MLIGSPAVIAGRLNWLVYHTEDTQGMEDVILWARNHGYFEHSTYRDVRSKVPEWLSQLGTDSGRARLEAEYAVSFSPTMSFYTQHPELASIIEAGSDLNAFLNQLRDCVGTEPPYVLYHQGHPHLVVAFHNHSGGVCAADLVLNEPVVRFGEIDLENFDLTPYDETTVDFHHWVAALTKNVRFDLFETKSRSSPVRQ